ncbi:tail fiber assembly protein [Photobacterium sp. S4TG1]|uniref:tail fiber assembly protein n=1 Tax=Photobacterium TaxID=657 RepID=UPI002E190CA8|nr:MULTISPECIES: tail fiber assembly protein [Photobacterium]MEC6795444.1 tail fiber assembly protein [Photobacterium sp. S4TG1]MEC6906667.1 tail fiber assembly protein [Photobacterium piscicola]
MDSILINGQRIYGLNLNDKDYNGDQIYSFFGITKEQADILKKQNQWLETRRTRDQLMIKTDWTQANDAPLTSEKKAEFTAYRQVLRDIPQTYDNPDNIVWPTKPTL